METRESVEYELHVGPEVRDLLNSRRIDDDEVRRVIEQAEATSDGFASASSGRRLAHRRVSQITLWVEYRCDGRCCRVVGAYSHRMEILEGYNMPSKLQSGGSEWQCAKCNLAIEPATVKLKYLDETFAVDLPACPSCQRVFVSEEIAVSKMALAERMLEDK